jgi:hypothetical protein
MRILYIGQLSPNDSAEYRRLALLREGHTLEAINTLDYRSALPLLRKIEFRAQIGPMVSRLNHDVLAAAERMRPDVVWADKVLWMRPQTLNRLRSMGIATVSYMIDNFFGPRRDPGWRLYAKTIPLYDLHCTQRDTNVTSYREAGARDVIKIQTAFEPTLQFPHDPAYTDAQRNRDVSFIGTSYDQRAQTVLRLHADGVPVVVSGGPQHWRGPLGSMFDTLYREAIWRSKINLSFLTHSNQDEFVHKSFEIAACGGFLLAERSAGHLERFVEDEEAVFFEGYDELLAKIRRYLPDEAARNRIALAGMKRAWTSGYDNDSQVRKIVVRLQDILNAKKSGAA